MATNASRPATALGVITPRQAQLVLDVTRMLAITTDLDALLQRIAEATCELLACERASIFLHDPKTDELWTKVALQSAEIRVPQTAGIVGATFTSNQVQHVPDPYADPRFNRAIDKRTGFVTRNLLAAPLWNFDRRPLGVIQAINKSGGGFAPDDHTLLQLLADQAGVALQRHYLQQEALKGAAFKHEMDLARRVQDAMLPKRMPDVPGVEATGWTRPASVTGGDCFDLWRTHDGRLAIFLADASGHGLAPTLVVSQVRTLVRAFADVEPEPRRLLERANARLAEDLEAERFVTAFLAFLAPDGTLEWCSAGHGPIFIRSAADQPVEELVPNELPLGIMPDFTGEAALPASLARSGMLAVVSDGIFEAMNTAGEQFGMARVLRSLDEHSTSPPQAIITCLKDAATQWSGSEDPTDDQTIVIARRL